MTDNRPWQLTALTAIALLVGYIAGSAVPHATAQPAATKVQLDTSNCHTRIIDMTRFGDVLPDLYAPQEGRIFTAIETVFGFDAPQSPGSPFTTSTTRDVVAAYIECR